MLERLNAIEFYLGDSVLGITVYHQYVRHTHIMHRRKDLNKCDYLFAGKAYMHACMLIFILI